MTSVALPQTPPQHGARAHTDGGWDASDRAVVPVQTRSARFTSTDVADFPAVTGREAEWKLTPVARIAALIDGPLDGSPYSYSTIVGSEGATPEVAVEWVGFDDSSVGFAGAPEEKASANAWTCASDVLSVSLAGSDRQTVTITRSDLGREPRAGHMVIRATTGSQSTVIVQSSGDAVFSENIEIVVEDDAWLTVVSVQEWNDGALHLASHFATVGRNARLTHMVVSLGGDVVRVNPSVHLVGEGADAELYGLYFADAGQHLEQRVYLEHVAANTRGRVNYKGALQGAGARTVWVGDVLIGPAASGTDSYEQNRNLVLSGGTRADSIPNLEIETGDIIGAGHASATGRFDDEQLFYLQARGITEPEARRLVVIGFLSEIVQKIGDDDLEARLIQTIQSELSGAQA